MGVVSGIDDVVALVDNVEFKVVVVVVEGSEVNDGEGSDVVMEELDDVLPLNLSVTRGYLYSPIERAYSAMMPS